MIEKVQIPADVSLEVNRAFYEYNAALNISGYLMSRPGVQIELLQQYLDATEMKYATLEMLKEKAVRQYPPTKPWTTYEFNFDTFEIYYEVQ